MKITCIFSLFALGFLFSCKKKEENINFHENYFPLKIGTFVEFKVTYIYHDHASGIHDTTTYKLKTVIGDTIIDNAGRVAYKYYRYIYDEINQEYKVKDLWTCINDQHRIEFVEENQRIIKLVLAPSLYKEWDMNAFNSFKPMLAYYENIHKPFQTGGKVFDSTVTVIQQITPVNLIEYRRKTETYAKHIGLIDKYYKDLSIINFDTLQPQRGEELFYKVIDYGVE
jgi:hypothetical protein